MRRERSRVSAEVACTDTARLKERFSAGAYFPVALRAALRRSQPHKIKTASNSRHYDYELVKIAIDALP